MTPGYPHALRGTSSAPRELTVSASLEPYDAFKVAIVGSRAASALALAITRWLAFVAARSGHIVISGGAEGVDTAAHEGALEAEGRTWLVCGHGMRGKEEKDLRPIFAQVQTAPGGVLIWPFHDTRPADRSTYPARNKILVGLADVVVVVQAGDASGALNAAKAARALGRRLVVVSPTPLDDRYLGSARLIDEGAEALVRREHAHNVLKVTDQAARDGAHLLHAFAPPAIVPGKAAGPARPEGAPPADEALLVRADASATRNRPTLPALGQPPPPPLDDPDERLVFSATSDRPAHTDALASSTALPPPRLATALLTLALKNVVVEGPEGFFRRKNGA